MSAEQRDRLADMYAPLVEATPPGGIVDKVRPGGTLSGQHKVDCSSKSLGLSEVLTGHLRREGPRTVVDLFTGMGGGAELDLLELRLHELDGIADIIVVTESRFGNRCDKKLLHFERQRARFEQFLPRILHVVTDRCPRYQEKAENCHRKEPKKRPKAIYFQEEEQRSCAFKTLEQERPNLTDSALVLLTDLDEIPNGKVLHALKHCELRPEARLPLRLQLQVIPFSLRSGCPEKRKRYNKGNVALWSQVKLGKVHIWPKSHTDEIPYGGVHLTSMGSRAQLDYRLLNHGESGQILPLVLPGGADLNTCNVTTVEQLRLLQQQLTDAPLSVMRHWENHDPNKKLKRADASALAKCELPWMLLANPARYPFIWGEGTWN